MESKHSLIGLGLLAVCLVCCGCAPAKPPIPTTIPFTGKVSLDGKPLEYALIVFVPVDGADSVPFSTMGTTNEEGEYELVTRLGDQEKPGAVPGSYKVLLRADLRPALNGKAQKPVQVPMQFSDPDQTILEVTVPDDGGTEDFELKS